MRGRLRVTEVIRRFQREESGATAIEYGLIATLIFLALTGALAVYGNTAGGLYTNLSSNVSAVMR